MSRARGLRPKNINLMSLVLNYPIGHLAPTPTTQDFRLDSVLMSGTYERISGQTTQDLQGRRDATDFLSRSDASEQ